MIKNKIPFTLIIDKQEKIPYIFEDIDVKVKKLKTGDYSIEGYENDVTIERKSLDDYVKSLTEDRERFLKEIRRLQDFKFSVIIVEGSLPDIRAKKYENQNINPENIIGSTVSIMLDYKIPVLFASDRQNALDLSLRFLIMYWDHKISKSSSEKRVERKKEVRLEDLL